MPDIDKFADDVFAAVEGYVAAEVLHRMKELDARIESIPAGTKGEKGDAGTDGRNVDPDMVSSLVADKVGAAVAALPKPADGKDADSELLRAEIDKQFDAMAAAFVDGLKDG